MKLEHSRIFKNEVLPIKQFAAQSGGISSSAVYYAIDNNLIDYVEIGDRRYVVMSKVTRQYKPNSSPNRKPKKSKAQVTRLKPM